MGNKSFNDKYEIYSEIDKLISSGSYPSTKYICEQLKLSESTFYDYRRDLINEFHAPIDFSREHGGYYYTKEFNLFTNTIKSEEIHKIALIRKLLSAYSSDDIYNKSSSVLAKLFPSITDLPLLNRFDVAKRPVPRYSKTVYTNIVKAIEHNYVIDFNYMSKWEPDHRHRRVMPYQIIIDDGNIYLYAADIKDSSKTRLFNLTKINHVDVITRETFELPENYRFEQKEENGRFGAFQYDEYYFFKIEFYGDARNWIKECIWSDDQIIEEDNNTKKTVLSFTSGQWIPIERWLISFAHLARPIEPDWLVDFWQKEIREMQKISESETPSEITYLFTQNLEKND